MATESFLDDSRRARKCKICGESHSVSQCEKFLATEARYRWSLVKKHGLCANCLLPGHMAKQCKLQPSCKRCDRKHHTLLHFQRDDKGEETEVKQRYKPGAESTCAATASGARVCLRVVPVDVHYQDRRMRTYALLDDGSDSSLCEDSLLRDLDVKGLRRTFDITTVTDSSKITGTEASIKVSAVDGQDILDIDHICSLPSLPINPNSIPEESVTKRWPHLKDVTLPQIENKDVRLLIGSDVPEAFWNLEERRGKAKQPYAVRTPLGWSIMGPVDSSSSCNTEGKNVNLLKSDRQMHEQLKKIWAEGFENAWDDQTSSSIEDKRAIKIANDTIRLVDGHYQVGLPWKQADVQLPNNRLMAELRLKGTKRRLQGNGDLHERYSKTLNGYIDSGYAEKVPTAEVENTSARVWYLPHHPVYNPQKPKKTRVVFDCAASYRGTSLNNQLLQGPDQANSLIGVILRFRKEPVAVVGDIESMFHQVRCDPTDRDVMRFLWWPNGDLGVEPEEYRMCVHPFGATSSPFCAGFCLRRTAIDNNLEHSQAVVDSVQSSFYVDDYLHSVGNTEEAINVIKEMGSLLQKGGFKITKWLSNSQLVMSTVPDNRKADSMLNIEPEQNLPVERALGVKWDLERDTLKVAPVNKENILTRRGLLSFVGSLYDPLGLSAPIILPAKLLLQGLCSQKIDWDDEIPEEAESKWKKWKDNLMSLDGVAVSRCYAPQGLENSTSIQIHHFSDASERALGTASYLRSVDRQGYVYCTLLLGKSRVTPIKTVSIPRLELAAATLAVQVDGFVKRELQIENEETYFWTDSMAVMRWILNDSKRFKTYVANRVAKIQEGSRTEQWRHVPSDKNPADYASRGLDGKHKEKLDTWLKGPKFLFEDESRWPKSPITAAEDVEQDQEFRTVAVKTFAVDSTSSLDSFIQGFSDWTKLRRATAWILRYKRYLYSKHIKIDYELEKGPLSALELQQSSEAIVSYVQRMAFREEFTSLERGNRSLRLRSLNPVLIHGSLRVGGRLSNAPIEFEAKHQLILPYDHKLTDLIINHYHTKELAHMGANIVLSAVRKHYWILKGRAAVRRVLSKCFQCRRYRASRGGQLMAQLPKARVTPDKPPFSFVGVDYFGPMQVKEGRRVVKRYGCLFTCMASRAVHIEVANSLELDSFLAAFQRFTSRRGQPECIYSDNGTNFKGGERILRESIENWNQHKLCNKLHQQGVQWRFNTPTASHMGGVWERVIRTTRQILKHLLKDQLVTDEVLRTFIAEVERIINDRPLTSLSNNPFDLEPLTPSKLLLLRSNSSLPAGIFIKEDMYGKRWWRQAQYLASIFWRRWTAEYLPTLQIRQKWCEQRKSIKEHDVVLVVDERLPRGQWPLGVVVAVYPDKDGHTRSVKVRTGSSFLMRPIHKLCFLEGDQDELYNVDAIQDAKDIDVAPDCAVSPDQSSRRPTAVRRSSRLNKKL